MGFRLVDVHTYKAVRLSILDYRVPRCQVIFYTKVLVNDILVGLVTILDYTGVRLEKLNCKNK